MSVPLSENEQRILQDIESHFYESDPDLAREVSKTTVYTHALRNFKWAVCGLLAGMVIMVATISFHPLYAFCGFLWSFSALLFVAYSLRDLGRAGRGQMIQAMRRKGLIGAVDGAGSRMKERFDRNGRSED